MSVMRGFVRMVTMRVGDCAGSKRGAMVSMRVLWIGLKGKAGRGDALGEPECFAVRPVALLMVAGRWAGDSTDPHKHGAARSGWSEGRGGIWTGPHTSALVPSDFSLERSMAGLKLGPTNCFVAF